MKRIGRYSLVLLLGFVSAAALAATTPATLYPMPNCSCCENYAQYLDQHGFHVTVSTQDVTTADLKHVAKRLGVPLKYRTAKVGMDTGICHVTTVGGYVVVGHVPAKVIRRLLQQHPQNIAGIILPGMPKGSPGMTAMGKKTAPFVIYAFNAKGKTWVYATV